MALVRTGSILSVTLIDSGGNLTTKEFQLTAADIAAAVTDGATIRTALLGVTDSVIASYRVSDVYVEDALVLPASAENEVRASITTYVKDNAGKKANISIPAPKIGMFDATSGAGKNTIGSPSNGGGILSTYLALFQTGGQAYASDGEVLEGFVRGVRTTVKSRQA